MQGILDPLEESIENSFCDYVEKRTGIRPLKIHKRGWPDRLVSVGDSRYIWIEFKRNKNIEPRKLQKYIHNYLRVRREKVYVCGDKNEAIQIFEKERSASNPRLSKKMY